MRLWGEAGRMSARAPRPEPIMHPKALWDFACIVRYTCFGDTTVAEKFIADPEFPRPIHPTGSDGHPRWFAGDVWGYFEAMKKPAGGQSPTQ